MEQQFAQSRPGLPIRGVPLDGVPIHSLRSIGVAATTGNPGLDWQSCPSRQPIGEESSAVVGGPAVASRPFAGHGKAVERKRKEGVLGDRRLEGLGGSLETTGPEQPLAFEEARNAGIDTVLSAAASVSCAGGPATVGARSRMASESTVAKIESTGPSAEARASSVGGMPWYIVARTRRCVGCGPAAGQDSASEIERLEAGKWEALRNGNWLTMESLYDDSFYSLVYGPAGTLQESDKASTFSAEGQPPAAEFHPGEMRVIWAGRDAAIITYTVTGPMGYPITPKRTTVSSVWARKNGQWKTVFFQMSPEG